MAVKIYEQTDNRNSQTKENQNSIPKIINSGFAKGADVGWLPQMEATGYKFYDSDGSKKDCLQLLKDRGMNTIRLRVWVNPSDDKAIVHLSIIPLVLMWLYKLKLYQLTQDFQYGFFLKMEDTYKAFLGNILTKKSAWLALIGLIGLLFLSFILLGVFPKKVLFFSDNIPNQIIT